ncbi:MAG: major capsid protein [Acidimicrobiia bacterium]|nr:major capsid protein [Acidimicrobiia bacterium]
MKWPQIPETLAGLSAEQLRELAVSLRTSLDANLAVAATPEDFDEYDAYKARFTRIDAMASEAEAAETAEAEAAAAAEEAAQAEEAETEAAEVEEETEEQVEEEVAAAIVTTTEVETLAEIVEDPTPDRSGWYATPNGAAAVSVAEGYEFGDMSELAAAIMERANSLQDGSDVKHVIAQQRGNFSEQQDLTDDAVFNLQKLQDQEELTAAMCAPLTPLYDLACSNTMRRPVANGLPQFRLSPDRGGFTVYPSPSLSDITTGYGQWTSSDDSDAEALKTCQTITCSSPVEYEIYAIYRCLTVKHLVQMTFPEIVEAYLNRLGAAWARFAETLLLEAMGNGSTQLATADLAYGGTTGILSTVLNYIGLYQEIERWDNGVMDAWMPRWVLYAIKTDMMRRRRTDGGQNLVPSDESINALFRNAGVEPHWFMDRPSWATPVPGIAVNGVLNFFPRSVEILVAPRGKFALMDRGNLNIGVTGNNQYRVDDDLLRNQFRFFFESFEGVINTNTCPAHILQIDTTCWNGVQIADEAMGCAGEDNPAVGS